MSIFKHRFNVHRPEEEEVRVVKLFHHRHRASPQIHVPAKVRTVGRHVFTVARARPIPLRRRPAKLEHAYQVTNKMLVKETFVDNPQNPFLTYYGPSALSFGVVSKHHMRNLPYAGWNVYWVPLEDMVRFRKGYSSKIGVIHPVLFWGLRQWYNIAGRRHLREVHEKVVGFEVADSDAISSLGVKIANTVDLVMVPSEASKQAYINSGLETRIEVVPHGVSECYNAPKNPLPNVPDGVKILFFELHSPYRKGGDVAKKVMSRILEKRKNVQFIIRAGADNVLNKLPRTTCFPKWTTEEDLVRLYDSCDILVCFSRGGAFELNVLEGMARGLVVVTSPCPPIKEYAKEALFIKSRGQVKALQRNPVHVGKGPDPDPDDAYKLVNYAIDNLPTLKKKAEATALEIREKYSWRNTAIVIAKLLGDVIND